MKKLYVRLNKMSGLAPPKNIVEGSKSDSDSEPEQKSVFAGRRHRRHTLRAAKGTRFKAKTLKRILKKAGLKSTGKKSTLRARARKAHLIRGGGVAETAAVVGGRRR